MRHAQYQLDHTRHARRREQMPHIRFYTAQHGGMSVIKKLCHR